MSLHLEVKRGEVAEPEHEDGGPVKEDGVGERAVRVDVHHTVVEHLFFCRFPVSLV